MKKEGKEDVVSVRIKVEGGKIAEAEYRLPVAVWKDAMEHAFRGTAWLRVRADRAWDEPMDGYEFLCPACGTTYRFWVPRAVPVAPMTCVCGAAVQPRPLRVVEGALVVVSAVMGVEVGTGRAWRRADDDSLARVMVVNMLDRERADFFRALEG
ncbi:MAG: DUF6084 family protein, partial [Thermoplasmatota archaeon]